MTLLGACILVLFVYIGVLMGIGIWSGRRTTTAADFIIGSRRIGPWVTALSFIAVYFSSVLIIGGGAFGYKFGMATIWIGAINVLVGCLLCWIVLGRRVRLFTERMGVSTISGFFAERYRSPAAGIFSAAVVFLFLIIYNVSVVKGMANSFQVLMDLPYWGGVLISGLVIIFYVVLGGYQAVVWTGFLQAWVMIFSLLLLTGRTVSAVGGFSEGMRRLAAIDPGYVSTPGVWGWAGLVSFCLVVSLGVWGMPQLLIRFYSIRDTKTFRLGTVIVTVGAAIAILPYLNGAFSRLLFPALANPDLAIPSLSKAVLSPWGAALLLAGVVAAGMSTFAGVLIIVSSSLVRDVYRNGLGRRLTGEQEVFYNRIVSAAVGLISLAIALKPPALILVLTGFSWAVIASTTLWPLLFGIYWRRASRLAAIGSMIVGSITAILWTWLGKPFGVHGFIAGSSAALVAIVALSLARKWEPPAGHLERIFDGETAGGQ
ncbi:MAG: sodium/proline symporter [Candidatus Krumholzibacteriota bacterium]|nr:sodium/proline symporter [Candidatus Krumholzibacteriota bacterium]